MTLPTPEQHQLGAPAEARRAFLMVMYRALWDNINRHILVVWQSITVLFAALGAVFLTDKKLLSPDLAFSLVIVAAAWSTAHAIDSKGWYNRNLAIIANIEREFLSPNDERMIHYFFNRPHHTTAIDHLRIQITMAFAVWGIVLIYHLTIRVLPGLGGSWRTFDPLRILPYILSGLGAYALIRFNAKVDARQRLLDEKSPGTRVDVKLADANVDVPPKSATQ